VPARRFSPDYWRDKYESHRLYQDMRQVSVRQQTERTAAAPEEPPVRRRESIRWREEWVQFRTLVQRAFTSKMRNRGNLIVTTLVPPTLAALIGWTLYFDESGKYEFASASHIPTYIFMSLLVAMFLALMNSADDIIRDRTVLHRERNLDVRLPYYIVAKFSTLALFSAAQSAFFVLVGNSILEIRGMFFEYWFFMFITAMSGTSLGLIISSLAPDGKAAANFVPLVLIPQLIFGGALIKYEEMNRDLDRIYSMKRWFMTHTDPGSAERDDSRLQVPLISRFVATHYTYEALIVAQAKLNPLAVRQDRIQRQIDALVADRTRDEAGDARLEDLKDTLALLSGLESRTREEVETRLRRVDKVIGGGALDAGRLRSKAGGITAERLYANQKVGDLVAKAETEQSDYRRQEAINVFFSPGKQHHLLTLSPRWLGFLGLKEPRKLSFRTSVYVFNTGIIVVTSTALLGLLHLVLKRQLRTRGM